MSAPPSLMDYLAAGWPLAQWCDVTVLVAISGGADSVALVRALHQMRSGGEGRLMLAHYNHRLRGADSDRDQAFVERLGDTLSLPVVAEAAASAANCSEASLRDERYAFLAAVAGQHGARYLATAHTADDQVETMLLNILRGTGLAGVAGIPRTRQLSESTSLVRPLLDVSRAEVLDYLQAIGQDYRQDATNAEPRYTRNRIRHELLPILERDFNPHVRDALLRLSRIAGEADELLDTLAQQMLFTNARPIPDGVELQVPALRDAPDLLARHALLQAWQRQGWPLQDMSFEKWRELLALARSQSAGAKTTARRVFPGGVVAELDAGVLRLTRFSA